MHVKLNIAACLILLSGFRAVASEAHGYSVCIASAGNTIMLTDTLESCHPYFPPWVCRAKTGNTEIRNFMCHNLGAANSGADPFTPGWAINGGYW